MKHEGDEIYVNMYGSLGWRHDTDHVEYLLWR